MGINRRAKDAPAGYHTTGKQPRPLYQVSGDMMNTQLVHRRTQLLCFFLSAVLLAVSLCTMGGCNRIARRWKGVDMNVPVDNVPPIMVDAIDGKYLLIMQAPNSGWSIQAERDERTAEGFRLFITVRRPDPAFMYPQAIVEKRLLSEVDSSKPIEIYARVLDANEKSAGKGYGKITPVERFDD